MSRGTRVTLELRTGRDCEQTAAAAAQFFRSLANPPHGLHNFWRKAPEFTLEFLNQGQTIYELITLPPPVREYISSQLTAAYPEVLIKELAHNPLFEFENELPKAAGEVVLTAPTYLPLRTFGEMPDMDSLASVLSALATLQEGETGLMQLRVRKVRDGWKKAGQAALREKVSPSGEKATGNPHKDAINQKLAQPGFQVTLRVLMQAGTRARAEALLKQVATSYSALQSESNSLILRKPMLKKPFIRRILNRCPAWKKQYFSVDELATFFHLPNKQLSTIHNIAWGKNLQGESPENLPTKQTISENDLPSVNLFAEALHKNQRQVFGLRREDRRRHLYVIGKSGTGKSTMLSNMIINDLRQNEGLAVIDPHGDLIETILDFIPKSRINDVIVFDPADPHAVAKMNLFEAGTTVHRELIASGIVAIFQKMNADSWGPRLEYILRNTLLTLLEQNAKIEDVLRILTDAGYRAKIVENLQDPILKNFWESEFNVMPERLRNEAISPILNKVGKFVTSPLIRNVVNTTTSSFDIEEAMNTGKIVLVNVSQGKLGEDNAALLGAMIITKIQLAAMNRVYLPEEQRRDFFLYIDEFQNFATTSFMKILSEARKYRLSLILANQYMAQLPDEVRAAIFGNAGSMISFILGASDAAWLEKEFGGKYTQEDLVSLARYQIIVKLMIDGQTSLPFPATTLGPATSKNQNRETVLRVSRERYARKRN